MKIIDLYNIIRDRQEHPAEGSYTNKLLQKGEDAILQKVGEEAVEVVLAAKGQGKQRLIEEVSDLTYHLLVMLVQQGVSLEEISAELEQRHKPGSQG